MSVGIRGRILGQGRPWLCAPLVGQERRLILQEAATLAGLPVDIGEWRYDLAAPLEGGPGSLLPAILEALGDRPLIFTYRTPAEKQGGGLAPLDYAAAVLAAAGPGRTWWTSNGTGGKSWRPNWAGEPGKPGARRYFLAMTSWVRHRWP